MKHYATAALAALLFLYVQCRKPDPDLGSETFELGKPFETQVTTSYTEHNGSLTLTLNRVISDSRCPKDAICIWEGSTEIALSMQKDGQSRTDTLSSNRYMSWPDSALFQGYKIKFVGVAPDAMAGVIIPQAEYRLKLLVTK